MTSFILLITSLTLAAVTPSPLDPAIDFFAWLESHAKEFAQCSPKIEGENYVLCDATRVPRAEIKRLFGLTRDQVITNLKEKGIAVEVLDEADPKLTSALDLHGKYLPETKTILIRKSATLGSLLHEYIHFLQSENAVSIYGKKYKQERNKLQADLAKLMDQQITEIKSLKSDANPKRSRDLLNEFSIASQALQGFAPWQDLIDERGIFLLYLKYGKEFGASDEDLAMARRNMSFICTNPKLTKLIPQAQCSMK